MSSVSAIRRLVVRAPLRRRAAVAVRAAARRPSRAVVPRRAFSGPAASASTSASASSASAEAETAAAAEAAPEASEAAAAAEAEEAAAAEEDERDAKIEELEARVKELTDLRLRAMAETENVRKRYQGEVEKTRVFGVEGMAKDLLSVVDALTLAIKHMPAEAHAEDASPALVSVRDGILITERALTQVLTKNGISKVESEGAKFDPTVHDLKLQVEVPGKEPNTVVEVIRDGYVLGGRAIRAAEVIATKPAPKQ